MRLTVRQADRPLTGSLTVPGDKSISHRAVLFAAMANGTSYLSGVLDSADVRSTIAAVSQLGAHVSMIPSEDGTGLAGTITGWGQRGPREPHEPIDCGNSGTTTRLLLGMLAGWPITVTLTGDESLSKRPMARVTDPLTAAGATFTTCDGRLPVTVRGAEETVPLEYDSPVASAQVKSAVLLAGLRAFGRTTVREPAQSRDHTERMLPVFGVPVGTDPSAHAAWIDGPSHLRAADFAVPADPSSAAFPVVAALLVPGSEITLEHVALNQTRTGFLRVVSRMGAGVDVTLDPVAGSEPSGRITVRHTPGLSGTTITAREVPSLIDEIPVLAVLAATAHGVTRFEGVRELRVKESDRLTAIVDSLTALDVHARAEDDTLSIIGSGGHPLVPQRGRTTLDSLGDHRLAMSWAVAGLATDGPIHVEGFEAVDVSYPRFRADLASLGAW